VRQILLKSEEFRMPDSAPVAPAPFAAAVEGILEQVEGRRKVVFV
jgi:hypothetical protein